MYWDRSAQPRRRIPVRVVRDQGVSSFQAEQPTDISDDIDNCLLDIENPDDPCSTNNIAIDNNISSLKIINTGNDNDYNPGF